MEYRKSPGYNDNKAIGAVLIDQEKYANENKN